MEHDQKDRACRLAAQLLIAEQLLERSGPGGGHGLLKTVLSAAAGNAYSLARSLSVTEDEIQAATEALRNHKAYQGAT
jgi:hypothetical protein